VLEEGAPRRGPLQGFETPLALDRYKRASTELPAMLGRVVYPALREDPANESGQHPIRFRPGGFRRSRNSVARSSSTSSPSASRRRQCVALGPAWFATANGLPQVIRNRRHFEPLTTFGQDAAAAIE